MITKSSGWEKKPTVNLEYEFQLFNSFFECEYAPSYTDYVSIADNEKPGRFIIRNYGYLSVFLYQLDLYIGRRWFAWNHKRFILLADDHVVFMTLHEEIVGICQ